MFTTVLGFYESGLTYPWIEKCKNRGMKMKRKMISFSFLRVVEHQWNDMNRGKPK
jgi:hypothetical protein